MPDCSHEWVQYQHWEECCKCGSRVYHMDDPKPSKLIFPRKLSTLPSSPNYDLEAAKQVDKVFCDGVHVVECVMYDMDAGKAKGRDPATHLWSPMVNGKITVLLKTGEKIE